MPGFWRKLTPRKPRFTFSNGFHGKAACWASSCSQTTHTNSDAGWDRVLVWHGSWRTVGYVCLGFIFRDDQKCSQSPKSELNQFVISPCSLTDIILNITDSVTSEQGLRSLNVTCEHFYSLTWESELSCSLFRLALSLLIVVSTHVCAYVYESVL